MQASYAKPMDGLIQAKSNGGNSFSGTVKETYTSMTTSSTQDKGLIYSIVTFPITAVRWYINCLLSIVTWMRGLVEQFFFALQSKIIPLWAKTLEWPFNTLLPWLMGNPVVPYFVPYLLWDWVIQNFGSEYAMYTGNVGKGDLEKLTEQLAQVAVEKNALLDVAIQNRKLQAENDDLKKQLREFESNGNANSTNAPVSDTIEPQSS